jgi:succinate dehydrogenase flavin-adding protein (antitoxin of CptAB toxin-antitoxin module)
MAGRMKIRRAKFTIDVRGMRKLDFLVVSFYSSENSE